MCVVMMMMVMRTTMGEIVMSKTPRRGTGRGRGRGMMIVCVVMMMMMVMRTTISKIVMSKT